MSAPDNAALEAFKEELSSTFRAISGDEEARVEWLKTPSAGGWYDAAGHRLRMPEPQDAAAVSQARGEADAQALYLKHHNEEIAAEFCHEQDIPHTQQQIIERMERMRVEALGARQMEGVAYNLHQRLEQQLRSQGYHRKENMKDIPLEEVMALLAYQAMTDRPLPKASDLMISTLGQMLGHKVAKELKQLPDVMDDQQAYLRLTHRMIQKMQSPAQDAQTQSQESDPEEGGESEEEQHSGESSQRSTQQTKTSETRQEETANDALMRGLQDDDGEEQEKTPTQEDGQHGQRSDVHAGNVVHLYRPYTTRYDKIVKADALVPLEELRRHRDTIDRRLSELRDVTGRLAARLQRLLLASQLRSWDFHMEEGILDAGKLTHLVIDPTYAYPYKWERSTHYKNTVVSVLIDNSGSMRGRPIMMAALCADILARTLERCAVKVEVLGFTTQHWKGGESRKLWTEHDSPENPGRLNDLLHIIYKDADMPWRRSKYNLGLMLQEGLLKENIDGEAILWAHDRLLARPEERKILMVISDGAPVDDSTLSANPNDYLDRHLREVIKHVEASSPVEMLAIGIGHNVNNHYGRAVTIRQVDQLGDAMMSQLTELFRDMDRPGQRLRPKTL